MEKLTGKSKALTIEILIIVLLLLTGFGFGKSNTEGAKAPVTCADDLVGGAIGGIKGRMPQSSARIFYESMLGRRVSSYTSYASVAEATGALLSGKIKAACVTDVTADYMIAGNRSLTKLDRTEMAAVENTVEPRFEFGMAVRNDREGETLCGELNYAIDVMKRTGTLDDLIYKHITSVVYPEGGSPYKFDTYKEEALAREAAVLPEQPPKKLHIGITGAVEPIELLDERLQPTGFCSEFADYLGQILNCRIELLVLDNETVFTSLMSGRIDAVFCYGSGRVTTEGSRKWLTTEGYYPMYAYDFLVQGSQGEL